MKGINLVIAYEKHFLILESVITSTGLKIKVYRKKNIFQVTKIILKRDDFIVIKTVDNTFYRITSFNMLDKFIFRTSKIVLTVMALSGLRMLKFVFPLKLFAYIAPKWQM